MATSETRQAWNTFFADLVARGLQGVMLVTSDAHAGLVEAIAANLPGAAWQRCRTHYPELVIMSRLFVFVLVIVMLQMERSA